MDKDTEMFNCIKSTGFNSTHLKTTVRIFLMVAMVTLFLSVSPATAQAQAQNKATFLWLGVTRLPGFVGMPDSAATPIFISSNGSEVYGEYGGPTYTHPLTNAPSTVHYFRWRQGEGAREISVSELPKEVAPVGNGSTAFRQKSFITFLTSKKHPTWPENTPDGRRSLEVWGSSSDGTTICGAYNNGEGWMEAYLWSQRGGFVDLKSYSVSALNLKQQLVDPRGKPMEHLGRAYCISADGKTIAGQPEEQNDLWVLFSPKGFRSPARTIQLPVSTSQFTGIIKEMEKGRWVMSVASFVPPNGKRTAISPPRDKVILLPNAFHLPDGVRVGAVVNISGIDGGVGKPVTATKAVVLNP